MKRARAAAAGLALALLGAAAQAGERTLLLGAHLRESLGSDVQRVAVGDPSVLAVEVLTSRELLLLGKQVGRTSLVLWTDAGVVESTWRVERDLSMLRGALAEIYPTIRAEAAPDRDAIVLRGVVPDVRYARAAEAAAIGYLDAGGAGAVPLLQEGGVAPAAPTSGEPGAGAPATGATEATGFATPRGVEGIATGGAGVINLIRVEQLPMTLEQRIAEVIAPLGGERVAVRRVVRGEVPDDAADVFLLEGTVANQIALSRVLLAASQLTGGSDAIRVLANESGGLGTGGASGGGGASGNGALGSLTRIGSVSGVGFGSIGGSGTSGNALSTNVARATALEAGGGRILAFLEVEDLPQVRVEARIYEVNRNKLLSWKPEIDALAGDFDQAPLLPSRTGVRVQGGQAARVGSSDAGDLQAALSLIGGAMLQQWQVVAGHFAIDALFSLLEDRGIARSLAQPAITVLSGETASFQAGGQIPIDVSIETDVSNAANAALISSTVFADFGVNLAVRPLVGDGDVVTLDVTPDVSTPDLALTAEIADATGQDQSTTAFQTRSLQTSARLRDGQALLIGGLLSQTQSQKARATPWLSEVPGLGWLAQTFDRQTDDDEVVIVVTPAIVREPIALAPLWSFPTTAELLDRTSGNSAAATGTSMREVYQP